MWTIKIPKYILHSFGTDFPCGSDSKESVCNAEDLDSILESGRFPTEGNGYPTPVFLLGESHGQRRLAGYSPWSRKELDMTE